MGPIAGDEHHDQHGGAKRQPGRAGDASGRGTAPVTGRRPAVPYSEGHSRRGNPGVLWFVDQRRSAPRARCFVQWRSGAPMSRLLSAPVEQNLASGSLSGSDQTLVIIVGVVALVALAIAFVLRAGVLAAGTGTPKMQEISAAVQEGAAAYLGTAVPHAERLRGHRLRAAVRAPRQFDRRTDRPVDLLPDRRRVLGDHRLSRHVAGHQGQRPGRGRGQRRGSREGHADRLPHRWRGRPDHHRARPARRLLRRAGLRERCTEGARGLRVRRRHARHVHACRRRHLHQGRRRRGRPGRQGRAGHPGGRPAQRRHHRRQRRRQRRRLRRHGRRPVRVLRGDPGRLADPGLRPRSAARA